MYTLFIIIIIYGLQLGVSKYLQHKRANSAKDSVIHRPLLIIKPPSPKLSSMYRFSPLPSLSKLFDQHHIFSISLSTREFLVLAKHKLPVTVRHYHPDWCSLFHYRRCSYLSRAHIVSYSTSVSTSVLSTVFE